MEARCGYCHGIYDVSLAPDFNSGFSCAVCRAWRSLRELVLGAGLPRGIQADLASRIRGFEGEIRDFAESSGLVCSIRPTVWVPRPPSSSSRPQFFPARPVGPLGGSGYPFSIPSPAGSGVTSPGDLPPVLVEVKFEAATSKAAPVDHPSPVTPGVSSVSEATAVKVETSVNSEVAPLEELPPDYSGHDACSVEASSVPDTDYTFTAPAGGAFGGESSSPVIEYPPGNFSGVPRTPQEPPPARLLRRSTSRSSGVLSEAAPHKVKKKNKGRKKRERGQQYWSSWGGDYKDPRDKYGKPSDRRSPPPEGVVEPSY